MKRYRVNEVFYTLQGEGANAGRPAVFLRFSGCNLQCAKETHGFDCDTEFVSGVSMTAEEIVSACQSAAKVKRGLRDMLVVITGGEPLLQLDGELAEALCAAEFSLAVETNGTIEPAAEVRRRLAWICCSPKVAEHAIKLQSANEIRYVVGAVGGIPRPTLKVIPGCSYLSPAFDGDQPDRGAIANCIKLVKENPDWTLSLQTHKLLGIR